jgi:hypothetical protein
MVYSDVSSSGCDSLVFDAFALSDLQVKQLDFDTAIDARVQTTASWESEIERLQVALREAESKVQISKATQVCMRDHMLNWHSLPP